MTKLKPSRFDEINNYPAPENGDEAAMALSLLSLKPSKDGTFFRILGSIRFSEIIKQEQSRFILWGPVLFGFGAALGCGPLVDMVWYNLIAIILAFSCAILTFSWLSANENLHKLATLALAIRLMLLSAIIIVFGILAAIQRTNAVNSPIIADNGSNYFISGPIVSVDRNYKGEWRAKIKIDKMGNLPISATPKFVRISVKDLDPTNIGVKFSCLAQLQKPPKPIIPGAYDFARKAWFLQIGAVGFCKSKPIYAEEGKKSFGQSLQNLITKQRIKTSAAMAQNSIGGGGGFLAAVTTGDRSWISSDDMNALQASGLGHIVSVSGMHVSLISGIVYFTLLKFLALFGKIALRVDVRKIAAAASIFIAISYTVFSGAEAPAVRACLMCFVVFGAILLDRRAISMRGLAIAALLLLIYHPENAIDAGFQMSFLATMALVALWESIDFNSRIQQSIIRKVGHWVLAALFASFVAGLATMPIAVHNFGNITTYALVANLIATPINDFIVAPFSLLGALFSAFGPLDFGIADKFWDVARWGLAKILEISYFFASAPIANFKTNPLNEVATFLFVFATFWLCLWRTRLKFCAIIPIFCALFIWVSTPPPTLLIAPGGDAFLSLEKNNLKICYIKGAKFDAKRLIGAARLDSADTNTLLAQIEYPNNRKCRAGAGDFEIHYINSGPKQDLSHKSYGNSVQYAPPLLSLTYDNKTYAIDKKTAPLGAILTRRNGILILNSPQSLNAPWQTM